MAANAVNIPAELFSSSTIKSFRDAPAPVIIKTVQNTKFGFDKRKKALEDKYKPKPVPDDEILNLGLSTFRQVQAASVEKLENLLHRLDSRPTTTIFAQGFQPWNDPDKDPKNLRAYDLFEHLKTSKNDTVFVSTYQPDGKIPFSPEGFRYDIYAYGGIDLEKALAEDYDMPWQREIAFPGGVLPKFIKGAAPYKLDKAGNPVFSTYIPNKNFSTKL